MSQSDTYCNACSIKKKKKRRSRSAALIPKLSVDLNWFYTVDGKSDFIVFMLVPHIRTAGLSTYSDVKKKEINSRSLSIRRDQSIIQSINHPKNACLSDVCNTFILMDYMHYGPAADLICIPRCADYKITLLMHWFSPSKIDGTDEQKGTSN